MKHLPVIAAMLLAAASAFAQTMPSATSGDPARDAAQPAAPHAFGKIGADQVIGRSIYDSAGEKLGRISDIVVNRYDSSTAVLVATRGFLGISSRHVVVLLRDLEREQDRIVARKLTQRDLDRMSYQSGNWIKQDRD